MVHKHYYKRLAEKITTCWALFLWAFLALFLMAIALSMLPIMVQQILHAAFIEKNAETIQTSLLAIIMLLIIRSTTDFSGHYLMRKAGNHLCMQLNATLFEKLLNLTPRDYQSLDKHQATDTVLINIQQISQSTMQIITLLVRDTLIVMSLVLCLAWLNKDFALLVLLLIPFILLILQVIQGQPNADPRAHPPAFIKLANQLQRSIENYRQVRLYGGQRQECRRLKKETQSIQQNDMQQDNYKAFVVALCQLVILLIIVAITYLMLQQVLRETFSLDQISAFVAAALLLIAPIKRLASIPQRLQINQKYLEQVFSLLEQNIASDHDGKALPKIQGKLTFEHVNFTSQESGKPALCNIDLEIKPGETVALICEDKHIRSLFIDLMLGFHQPTTGKMLLDARPFTEIRHADLLAQFAMISNEPVILNDSVAGNIAYGSTECANEASITAVTHASLASIFVREMPDGLQTHVDESGMNITRQQWQKIAIARAMLKNAPILIIDDLWFQADQVPLNDALAKLTHNRTTIILTHAMPATRECIEHVFLLEDGVISEI